jgi:hypothetical protein
MNKIPIKFRGNVIGYYDLKSKTANINKEHYDEVNEEFGSHHIGISARSFAKSIEDYDNRTITSFDIIDFKPNIKK